MEPTSHPMKDALLTLLVSSGYESIMKAQRKIVELYDAVVIERDDCRSSHDQLAKLVMPGNIGSSDALTIACKESLALIETQKVRIQALERQNRLLTTKLTIITGKEE